MLRVAIIGAGPGGLCLAQGLRAGGAAVSVFERDDGIAVRDQGYRIHIWPMGAGALAACLPPASYQLFLATSGRSGRQVTVLSRKLRQLKAIPGQPAPGEVSVPVDRQILREVLIGGIEDCVRFGHELTHFENLPGQVRVHFGNGAAADADVIVGADGVGSAVRAQLLPGAGPVASGEQLICGKTLLDDSTRQLLPAALHDGFVAVSGFPRPVGMALGLMEFTERPPAAAARLRPDLRLPDRADYLMWALGAEGRFFPPNLRELAPDALRSSALHIIRRWHPQLRELVSRCEPDLTFALTVRTSREMAAWQPSRVTVIGDAIHAMKPAGGSGANVALRDAEVLSRFLADCDRADPVPAIGRYEQAMTGYGFAALRASQQASRRFIG